VLFLSRLCAQPAGFNPGLAWRAFGSFVTRHWGHLPLLQVYGCPIGGSLVQEQWAVDGSGSTYIWAALDDGFK
jgi:hypothetical protein